MPMKHSAADLERFNEEFRQAVRRWTDPDLLGNLRIEMECMERGFDSEGRQFRVATMQAEVERRGLAICPACGQPTRPPQPPTNTGKETRDG